MAVHLTHPIPRPAVAPPRSAGSNPLFQVLFAYDHGFGAGLRLAGTTVHPLNEPGTTAKFDLVVTLDGATDLFTGADVREGA